MEKRKIGKLEVEVVGLGCNQIGTTIDEKRSANVVAAALDHAHALGTPKLKHAAAPAANTTLITDT